LWSRVRSAAALPQQHIANSALNEAASRKYAEKPHRKSSIATLQHRFSDNPETEAFSVGEGRMALLSRKAIGPRSGPREFHSTETGAMGSDDFGLERQPANSTCGFDS